MTHNTLKISNQLHWLHKTHTFKHIKNPKKHFQKKKYIVKPILSVSPYRI